MEKWRLGAHGRKIPAKGQKKPNTILYTLVVYGKHSTLCVKGTTFGLKYSYITYQSILILLKSQIFGTT